MHMDKIMILTTSKFERLVKNRVAQEMMVQNVSLEKDYEKIITLLENLAPVWSDAEVNQRFFSLGMAVATKGTKDQRQRLITLCDKLLERDDLSRAVNALKSFLPYIKSM